MPDVFITHISDHKDVAMALKWIIRERLHYDTFLASDATSLRLGEEWWPKIKDALRTSKVLLCLLTKASISRPWVPFEAGAFWLRDKPVIPVCFGDMTLSDMPMPFLSLHGARLPEGLFTLLNTVNDHINPERMLHPPTEAEAALQAALLKTLGGEPFVLPPPPMPPVAAFEFPAPPPPRPPPAPPSHPPAAPADDLDDASVKMLELLTEEAPISLRTPERLARLLKLSSQKALYYVELLKDKRLIETAYTRNEGKEYLALTKKGRALLVVRGLL